MRIVAKLLAQAADDRECCRCSLATPLTAITRVTITARMLRMTTPSDMAITVSTSVMPATRRAIGRRTRPPLAIVWVSKESIMAQPPAVIGAGAAKVQKSSRTGDSLPPVADVQLTSTVTWRAGSALSANSSPDLSAGSETSFNFTGQQGRDRR